MTEEEIRIDVEELKKDATGRIITPVESQPFVVEMVKAMQTVMMEHLMTVDQRQRYVLANRAIGLMACHHFSLTVQKIDKVLEDDAHEEFNTFFKDLL